MASEGCTVRADLSAGSQGHRSQPHPATGRQLKGAVDVADANARALQVLNDRDGDALTVGRLTNDFDGLPMRGMGAMGKKFKRAAFIPLWMS